MCLYSRYLKYLDIFSEYIEKIYLHIAYKCVCIYFFFWHMNETGLYFIFSSVLIRFWYESYARLRKKVGIVPSFSDLWRSLYMIGKNPE